MVNQSQNPKVKKQTQQPSKPKTKIKDFDILPAFVTLAVFIICLISIDLLVLPSTSKF